MSDTYANDPATSFWTSQGGEDPPTQAWNDVREHVTEHSGDDDNWKERHAADREQAVVAAVDEVKNRDADRSDWDEARQYRDFVTERWPGTKIPDYIRSRLGWNEAFRKNPAQAQELWVREWNARSPFHDEPKPKPKAEMPPDLSRDGVVEWERLQAVKDALATVTGDRADADDYEATADLRALVKEKTGLSLSKFLERCCAVDMASFHDPYSVAARFGRFNGLPATEQHAAEMVATVQQAQKVEGARGWLDSLKAENRLPPDYDALENDIGDKLEFMNANGMRTGNYEADLDTAIRWARDTVLARQMQQQQGNAPTPPTSVLQGVMRTVSPGLAEHVERAKVEKARRASRSVTGSPTLPAAGPATTRRPGMSFDDDLRADIAAAYSESMGR